MISRYTSSEMAKIWSTEARLAVWVKVELAALMASEQLGAVPAGVHAKVAQKIALIDYAKFELRMHDAEKITKHDVIAFLTTLQNQVGQDGRYLHLGLTSSDVVDTAFALILRTAGEQIMSRADQLQASLWECAEKYRRTVCLGRTHGQAAESTTFGLKILSFVAELDRCRRRLALALQEISHAKMSGPVGNYGNIDPRVESLVMKELGLQVEDISTQVVPRDRHAVFFATLAIMAGFIERFAVEMRHLMRSEVAEAFEPFGDGQQGSSAMPHKRNPILSENMTGLARVIRHYAGAAFENQALWHERDISHSSVERIIAPDATTVIDFCLLRAINIVDGLEVDELQMKMNVERSGGAIFSEGILIELVKGGVDRKSAYPWIQQAAMKARGNHTSFAEELIHNEAMAAHLSAEEINRICNAQPSLKHVDLIFERVGQTCAQALPHW